MLTRKQLDLLDFINKRLARDGVPPSFDEMKDALNLRSKSGIHRLVSALEERGFIRRLAHRARAIEVVKLPDSLAGRPAGFTPQVVEGGRIDHLVADSWDVAPKPRVTVPLVGSIAAGEPIQVIEDNPPLITVPDTMVKPNGHHYALEVRGDSMIEAGINNGDVVVIRETSSVEEGDIVVAQIEGYEATLKRYRRKDDKIILEAANPAYPPRALAEGAVKVQGRLVGLIRTY